MGGRPALLDPLVAAGRPDAAPARCTKPPSGRAPLLRGRREDAVPDHDTDPDKPEDAGEPDLASAA